MMRFYCLYLLLIFVASICASENVSLGITTPSSNDRSHCRKPSEGVECSSLTGRTLDEGLEESQSSSSQLPSATPHSNRPSRDSHASSREGSTPSRSALSAGEDTQAKTKHREGMGLGEKETSERKEIVKDDTESVSTSERKRIQAKVQHVMSHWTVPEDLRAPIIEAYQKEKPPQSKEQSASSEAESSSVKKDSPAKRKKGRPKKEGKRRKDRRDLDWTRTRLDNQYKLPEYPEAPRDGLRDTVETSNDEPYEYSNDIRGSWAVKEANDPFQNDNTNENHLEKRTPVNTRSGRMYKPSTKKERPHPNKLYKAGKRKGFYVLGDPPQGLSYEKLPGWLKVEAKPPSLPAQLQDMPDVPEILRDFERKFRNRPRFKERILFYSGVTSDVYDQYARQNNLFTIFNLTPRRYWHWILDDDQSAVPTWVRISAALARWAKGEVSVMIGNDIVGAKPDTVWNSYERPILLQRGVKINWLDHNGKTRAPVYPQSPTLDPGREVLREKVPILASKIAPQDNAALGTRSLFRGVENNAKAVRALLARSLFIEMMR